MSNLNKPYLIKWATKDNEWHGTAIVMAITALESWEKFSAKWQKDYEDGTVDLDPCEIERFSIKVAAEEFLE